MADDPGCVDCGWRPAEGKLWPTLGPLAVRWISDNLICAEGDSYGQPLKLRTDQKALLYRWYEYCPRCDRWHYTEGLRGAARGDGKTTLIAAVACLEFGGPPELAPYSPNVVITATSWEQADILFSFAGTMLGGRDQIVKEAPLCGYFDVYDHEIKMGDNAPGRMFRTAAVAGTNEGGQPTLYIADEVHELGDIGDRKARTHTVLGISTTKRTLTYRIPSSDGGFREIRRGPGRVLSLSTAGFDVDHSYLGALYKRGRLAEHDPSRDPRFLMDWHSAPDGLDYENPEDRAKAVRAASAAADVIWDVQTRVRAWDNPAMQHHEWLRYYGNLWVDVAEESWLKDHPAAWAECRGAWGLQGDEPTVLAVDMALKRDSVAVTESVRLPDGRTAVTARIWNPGDGKIDHLEVFDHIRARAAELGPRFRGLVYDPRFFELPARMLEQDDGLLVIEFSQTAVQMGPACGLTFDRIVARAIIHDGDPELGAHVKAAVKREQERGFTLSKGKSKRRIDGAVAMCMGEWTLQQLAEPYDVTQSIW
jgi:phage terminase large subunit-like protein